jgi:hypothetical protein
MIDITTIQTFPVAPVLSQLQSTNTSLIKNNKQFKTALTIIGVLGGSYIAYRLIKKYNEDKQRTKNQLPRD